MAAEDLNQKVAAGKPGTTEPQSSVNHPNSVSPKKVQEQPGSLGQTLFEQVKANAAAIDSLNAMKGSSRTPSAPAVSFDDHLPPADQAGTDFTLDVQKPDPAPSVKQPEKDQTASDDAGAIQEKWKINLSKLSDEASGPDSKPQTGASAVQSTFVPEKAPKFTYIPLQTGASAGQGTPVPEKAPKFTHIPLQTDPSEGQSAPAAEQPLKYTYIPPQTGSSGGQSAPAAEQPLKYTYIPPQTGSFTGQSVSASGNPSKNTYIPPQTGTGYRPSASPAGPADPAGRTKSQQSFDPASGVRPSQILRQPQDESSSVLNWQQVPPPKKQTLDEAVKTIQPGQMGRYTIQKTIHHEEGEDGSNPEDTESIELTEIEKRRIENTPPAVRRRRNARRASMGGFLAEKKNSLMGTIRGGKNKGNSMSAENRQKRSEAAKAARKDLPAPSASRRTDHSSQDDESSMSRQKRLRRKEAAQNVRGKNEKKVIHTSAFRLNFDDDDFELQPETMGSGQPERKEPVRTASSHTKRQGADRTSSRSGRERTGASRSDRHTAGTGDAVSGKAGRSSGSSRSSARSSRQETAAAGRTARSSRRTTRPESTRDASRQSTRTARNQSRTSGQKRREEPSSSQEIMILRGAVAVTLMLLLVIILVFLLRSIVTKREAATKVQDANAVEALEAGDAAQTGEAEAAPAEESQPQEEAADTQKLAKRTEATEVSNLEPMSISSFKPHAVSSTEPSNLIEFTEVEQDGAVIDVSSYKASQTIDFGYPNDYTQTQGVITFRGNNFRSNPTYGYAEITENKLNKVWTVDTSSLMYGSVYWSGSGWTGQPLLVKWPKELRQKMNMYDWAKNEEELVEVIYACMDGYVYFLDLWTGKATRDNMYIGWTFKGAGALDPRGYPIMYLGAGYDSNEGTARAFIINLLDCSIMHTFGCEDEFSLRGSLSYFDSSALVDAETDTLIYPGENGIIYLIRLNTDYNEEAGTLSISPETVKWRYNGIRTSYESYWLGIEDSACIYEGYLFASDNGGNLMCLDLNTLELVWVQDVLDDSNGTPVLSVENGKVYLYISTSFHLGWRSSDIADIPIWKIDAETGEIVWHTDYDCYSVEDLSGGVLSTIALGAHGLSDYIYVTVSRVGETDDGVLACLNKKDGSIVWEHEAFYAWSSPVCVYNSDGSGKVVYCTCGGMMYLLDGITGEQYDRAEFGDTVLEASPAVYEDMLIIGSRDCHIYGYELL